jgi:hypothetical protein
MLLTCCADHSAPPRAVGTRIRVNSAAIARSDAAPRAWIFSMIGRTVAAWRSASAFTALTPGSGHSRPTQISMGKVKIR